ATFELTYRCNLKCAHCYLTPGDPYEEEMPVELWLRTIRELKELGVFYVTLTGGEPTLHPGFWELIAELNRQNILIRLFTNATTLSEKDIDTLVTENVRYVDISLHGADAATHEAVTGVPGSFARAVETVKRLRAAGVFVNLKGSLLKSNYATVCQMDTYMRALGGHPQLSPVITPKNDGSLEPLAEAVEAPEMCYVYDAYFARQNAEAPRNESKEARPPVAMQCGAGFSTLAVAPNGEVLPCLQLRASLGNVRRNALTRIWHHSPLLLELDGLTSLPVSDCSGCELADYCMRCPGLALIEEGSMWKPNPSACRMAQNSKTASELHHERMVAKRSNTKKNEAQRSPAS
ncbi:MAG TPA: radical SAM protein, partial [Candidatus Coatesbacteria bacterium]|nr:radical SAM protein [Candidatus Coatesbacteria bacterium]